jgi:hypothetical protein
MRKHLLLCAASIALSLTLIGCTTTSTRGTRVATVSANKGTGRLSTDGSLPRAEDPMALRIPARVMRIWIAPWEDSRGDLHAPGYVYTEIESRRWTLGAPAELERTALIRPLQIERRDAPKSTPPGRDTGVRRTPRTSKASRSRATLRGS